MVEIKSPFTDWHEASRENAARYVKHLMESMVSIPRDERAAYIEAHYLRGETVAGLLE